MSAESGYHIPSLVLRLRQIVGEEQVRLDEPLSAHTTFKIGGPADIYVKPDSIEEIPQIIAACDDMDMPYFVLGCGSDLLVSDDGYRGVIISFTDELIGVSTEGNDLICQAGVTLREAAEMACELGLTGLEFASGIPGSVGGACYMNAGAYGSCVADVLKSVCVLERGGKVAELGVDELGLGYRKSRIADEGLVVLSATFALRRGDPDEIREAMEELAHRREEKQPLDLPSAGSTFKRPEGYFAGKLIADAGLKGYQVGDAAVSRKHAGFVVNLGNATAADVREVIEHVQTEVQRQFGVSLEPEVRFLG